MKVENIKTELGAKLYLSSLAKQMSETWFFQSSKRKKLQKQIDYLTHKFNIKYP